MVKDVVTVTSSTVSCEGNGPATGHPKVYLTFATGVDKIVCPYCSRTFVLAADAKTGHGH